MSSTNAGRRSIRELGPDFELQAWKDYRSLLSPEEYSETALLEMLVNENSFDVPEGSPLPWTPLHAWRALAQMGSLAVIEPVARLVEAGSQHAYDDFEKIASLLGEDAVEPLIGILAEGGRPEMTRALAAMGLGAIGRETSDPIRSRIVEALMDQIRGHDINDGWVNGMAAKALVMMGEGAVGPELRQLHAQGRVQMGMDEIAELKAYFGWK